MQVSFLIPIGVAGKHAIDCATVTGLDFHVIRYESLLPNGEYTSAFSSLIGLKTCSEFGPILLLQFSALEFI